MSDLQLRRFHPDTATPQDWQAYHAFRHIRHDDDAIGEPAQTDADYEIRAKKQWPLHEYLLWVLWEGTQIVGNLEVSVRRPGTPDYAMHAAHGDGWIGVISPCQRRGYGTRLLAQLTQYFEHAGKPKLSINARTVAGAAFLANAGWQRVFLKMKNKLALNEVDWPKMHAWQDAMLARQSGSPLHWEVHVGRMPLPRWEALLEPLSVLLSYTPKDALDAPPPRYEMAGVRAWYEELDRQGGQHHMVLLKDGAGDQARILAASNADWSPRHPEWVSQYLTAVVPEMRGLGLAKAVKAKLLEVIRTHQSEATWVTTYNAHSNAPMLATIGVWGLK
jgi:GNAT superfamily N-acetyltransferase